MPKIRVKQHSNTDEIAPIDVKPQRQSITVKPRLRPDRRELPAGMKPWQPGQSGNPGGKSRVLAEILALGKEHAGTIIKRLIVAAETHPDPAVWIPAAREVLNRTFGKPSQQVELIGGVEHRHFVMRLPPVVDSAEAWERQYGDHPQVIDAAATELPSEASPGAADILVGNSSASDINDLGQDDSPKE